MLFLNDSDFSAYSTGSCSVLDTAGDCSFKLLRSLNTTIPWDPQELNLGTQQIGNTSKGWKKTCFMFGNPRDAFGGPCYIGKLTIFSLTFQDMRDMHSKCSARVALAVLIPGAVAGNSYNNY